MKHLIQLQQQIVPDLLERMEQRYLLLKIVHTSEPIGRRALAENADLTERQVRSEVNFLHGQGLLEVTQKGMLITHKGSLLLEKLSSFMKTMKGFSVLEKRVGEILKMNRVIIIPGDSDKDISVKLEMGKACVELLKQIVEAEQTIAVTGGTTMAAVAEMMTPLNDENNYLFIPARGGIGEQMESQASSIVSEMAAKSGGAYRLFHVPDLLSDSAYESLLKEPSIQDVLHTIKNASIVIHGIGDALTMALKRRTPAEKVDELKRRRAVGEAFGFYFNDVGETIYKIKTLGIQLEDLKRADHVIAVAGGKSKARAIKAYAKQGKSNVLITDSAAAEEIMRKSAL